MSGKKSPEKSRANSKGKKNAGQSRTRWHWWPIILALVLTPLAVKTAEILPLTGPNGIARLRMLYPYAMLFKEHALALSETTGEALAHLMLYLQFPLYGLIAALLLYRRRWTVTCMAVVAIHFVGFGLLLFLGQH